MTPRVPCLHSVSLNDLFFSGSLGFDSITGTGSSLCAFKLHGVEWSEVTITSVSSRFSLSSSVLK